MVTTPEQYNAYLHLINNTNPPTYARVQTPDNTYNIDLDTHTVSAPNLFGVEQDHESETIYFIVDRINQHMDLSTTCCVIYYTNAAGRSRVYQVPFYDIYTYAKDKKMLIPWCLDAAVMEKEGIVKFYIRFFKVDRTSGEPKVVYDYHTLPAQSTVLHTLKIEELDSSWVITTDQYDTVLTEINDLKNNINKLTQIEWVPAGRQSF